MSIQIQALAKQYTGASLAKLVETHVKRLKAHQLSDAIQETYLKFPEAFRPAADEFSLNYSQAWMGPKMVSGDLGEMFLQAVGFGKEFAEKRGINLDEEQAFELFNLTVMRVAHFAHNNPNFRKSIGIKKGWFS